MVAAALFHDIGKPNTAYWDEKDNDWHCKSHCVEGERIFRKMFIDEEIVLREKVAFMIRYHMVLHSILLKNEKSQENKCHLLIRSIVDYPLMIMLNTCDNYGSENNLNTPLFIEDNKQKLYEIIRKYNYSHLAKISGMSFNEKPTMYIMIGIPGSGKQPMLTNWLRRNISISLVVTLFVWILVCLVKAKKVWELKTKRTR